MNGDPQAWISALRGSHERLSALVVPLVPDGVETKSQASDWTVAQVLSHLGSQAEIFSGILDAALDGTDLPGPEAFPPVWDAWNSRTPVDQVVDSLAANAAFLERVEDLSDAQLKALRFAMFGMDLDVVGFLRMRLSEYALHSWDVAAALDPGATVSGDAVALLIDTLPDMASRVGKPQDVPFRLRVVTSDPDRDLALLVDDAVRLEKADGESSDAVLRLPAEAFVRLVYGRLDDAHTPRLQLDGDGPTLDQLRSVFPGF